MSEEEQVKTVLALVSESTPDNFEAQIAAMDFCSPAVRMFGMDRIQEKVGSRLCLNSSWFRQKLIAAVSSQQTPEGGNPVWKQYDALKEKY
jgi:hypothetical protein